MSRSRQVEVMASTSGAMTAATFQLFLVAVLAATLIEELGVARWQLGVLGAVNTGIGAVSAPRLGRIADELGARPALVLVFLSSGIGLLATAAAPDFWWLVVASAISGLPQGASNPVTNKVIAEEVAIGGQGTVMGVKQSGVQFAVFLAGATLPSAAASFGWRWAVAAAGVVSLAAGLAVAVKAGLAGTAGADDEAGHDPGSSAEAQAAVVASAGEAEAGGESHERLRADGRAFVRQVAVYAFLLGLAAGGVSRFYPLFANEVLGYSEAVAGLSVSLSGVAAIVARLVWARLVEGAIGLRPALVVMGVGGAVTIGLLYVAQADAAWLLWPIVLGLAFTTSAWNVVAMLAVIRSVPITEAGGATGTVLLGFLGGLTLTAPLVGYSIDQLGSYRPAWVALAALSLAGALVVLRPRPTTRPERSDGLTV